MTRPITLVVLGLLAVPAMALLLIVAVISALFGGGGTAGASLGPPVNLGGVHPPAAIVTLDVAVAKGAPCHVSASLLLAQQSVESGYDPTARSGAGAIGLAQFLPGTFAEYDHPTPPGGAVPPTPADPTDAAWAEVRYLCSLGVAHDPTAALIAYNCGNVSPACVRASSHYADEILALARSIATPSPPAAVAPGRPASPVAVAPKGGAS